MLLRRVLLAPEGHRIEGPTHMKILFSFVQRIIVWSIRLCLERIPLTSSARGRQTARKRDVSWRYLDSQVRTLFSVKSGDSSQKIEQRGQPMARNLWPHPNNRRIASVMQKHANLLSESDYQIACKFFEHVEGFEQNCYERREGVPRFPKDFADMVRTDGNT